MAHYQGCTYFDPEFVPLSELIPPLNVCFDNETYDDCTLIKVDGANRHGILLNITQVLGDLGINIFKSYISSDNSWFMDVFHVVDHDNQKIKDPAIIEYVQQSLNVAQRQNESLGPAQVKIRDGNIVNVGHFASECNALEITFIDRPRIFYEIINVLFELSYVIDSGELWTHNDRIACILYIKERDTGKSIFDQAHFDHLEKSISNVVGAHHLDGELWDVRLQSFDTCRIHTERRLHQLMQEHKDYEVEPLPLPLEGDHLGLATIMEADGGVDESSKLMCQPQVSIECWKENDYLVVNIKSTDRPKLMFDIICALTNLDYDLFHGSIHTNGSIAFQEYFVRKTNGCTTLDEMEKLIIARSLAAAVNRRMVKGKKMEVRTFDQHGLLSKISRVLEENSLTIKKIKFCIDDILAVGNFYVIDSSSPSDTAYNIDQEKLEALQNEINNKDIYFEKHNDSNISLPPARGRWNLFYAFYSLGKKIWSHVKRFFSCCNFIR